MAEYMITRASIINRCWEDGKLHLKFTKKERPCREAYLKELIFHNPTKQEVRIVESSKKNEVPGL